MDGTAQPPGLLEEAGIGGLTELTISSSLLERPTKRPGGEGTGRTASEGRSGNRGKCPLDCVNGFLLSRQCAKMGARRRHQSPRAMRLPAGPRGVSPGRPPRWPGQGSFAVDVRSGGAETKSLHGTRMPVACSPLGEGSLLTPRWKEPSPQFLGICGSGREAGGEGCLFITLASSFLVFRHSGYGPKTGSRCPVSSALAVSPQTFQAP